MSFSLNSSLPRVRHLVRLARLDRPVGTTLLLWPTLTALWLASDGFPGWHLFLVFTLGTLLTRSAGCVVNDLADMHLDGHVKRTANRPLVLGQVTRPAAIIFACGLLLLSLLLVLTTNLYTLALSVLAVIIAIIYPLMKRYTYLPQGVLGIAFSWGIPMSFTAATNTLPNLAWLLFIANLLWVVAYDTQYAMVDRDDDVKLGIKSTAILFADLDRVAVAILQLAFLGTMLLVPGLTDLSLWYHAGLCGGAGLFIYQHYLIKDRQRDGCFQAFLNNNWVGLCVFGGVVLHYIF